MREISSWRASLVRRLRQQWPSPVPAGCTPALLCDVELGLSLLEQLAPGLPAHALWVLLTGYPFPTPEKEEWTPDQLRRLGNGRHLLLAYRSEYAWRRALERYRRIEPRLRRYEVDEGDARFTRREVTVCADRGEVYGLTLDRAPRHRTAQLRWATPGEYQFVERRHLASVKIPPDLTLSPLGTPPGGRAAAPRDHRRLGGPCRHRTVDGCGDSHARAQACRVGEAPRRYTSGGGAGYRWGKRRAYPRPAAHS